MSNDIDIEYSGRMLGAIDFVRSPSHLHAIRSASGFELLVPLEVTLRVTQREQPRIMVSNLRGKVSVKLQDGSLVTVGRLYWQSWQSAGITTGESYLNKDEIRMEWSGTFSDLQFVEKLRDGRPPKLHMSMEGEWCFLVPIFDEHRPRSLAPNSEPEWRPGYSFLYQRTDPMRIYNNHGPIEVAYPREVWIEMIKRLGLRENVLVEVPLPTSPLGVWDGVWKALIDARNALEQGGGTGWQSCVTAVRRALEIWQDIERPDQGPGWKAPTQQEREQRTKKQRLDALRWHLMQAAHLAPHSGADEWSRDDAVLMISTLSALLAERKP